MPGTAERTISVAERDYTKTVTIADSSSLSGATDLGYATFCGFITPSGWTTAAVSFAAATSLAGTYYPVLSASGAEITTGSVAASKWVALDPADFAGIRWLKIQSGTSAVPVNQSGGDIITLVLRGV